MSGVKLRRKGYGKLRKDVNLSSLHFSRSLSSLSQWHIIFNECCHHLSKVMHQELCWHLQKQRRNSLKGEGDSLHPQSRCTLEQAAMQRALYWECGRSGSCSTTAPGTYVLHDRHFSWCSLALWSYAMYVPKFCGFDTFFFLFFKNVSFGGSIVAQWTEPPLLSLASHVGTPVQVPGAALLI